MAHAKLSELSDWQLVHEKQDIRNWKMQDAAGHEMGTVDDLIADTETERVERIVLHDGREYDADDIEIGDGVVYLRGQVPDLADKPVVRVYDDVKVRRREPGT